MPDVNIDTFVLTQAHIDLVKRLNVKMAGDDAYGNLVVPCIDDKRPFGNSYMLGDVLRVMGVTEDGHGTYTDEQVKAARLLLCDLPAAYRIMMENATFMPGVYPVRQRTGVTYTRMARNHIHLLPFLERLKSETMPLGSYNQICYLCHNITDENPFRELKTILETFLANAETEREREQIRAVIATAEEEAAKFIKDDAGPALPEKPENTLISYMYRDADNYKIINEVVVSGLMSDEQIARIMATLDDGEFFIPTQVGLPANDMTSLGYSFDVQSDHPWFTLPGDGVTSTLRPPTEDMTADELVAKFEKAAADGWDESLWKHADEARQVEEDGQDGGEA